MIWFEYLPNDSKMCHFRLLTVTPLKNNAMLQDDLSLSNLGGFPKAFVDTVKKAKKELSLRNLGHVYEEPIQLPNDVSVIVAIAYISQPDAYTELLGKKRVRH